MTLLAKVDEEVLSDAESQENARRAAVICAPVAARCWVDGGAQIDHYADLRIMPTFARSACSVVVSD